MSVSVGPVEIAVSVDWSDPQDVIETRERIRDAAALIEHDSEARMLLMVIVGAMSVQPVASGG